MLKIRRQWDSKYRGVKTYRAIDGNTLTKSCDCITAGTKLIGIASVFPLIRKWINLNHSIDKDTDNSILTQSRDCWFAPKMVMGQESKETVNIFGNLLSIVIKYY